MHGCHHKEKLVVWLVVSVVAIVLVSVTTHHQALQRELLQRHPLIHVPIAKSAITRIPARSKQTSIRLDTTDYGISYLENNLFESSDSGSESFDHLTFLDEVSPNQNLPDFAVNKTSNLFHHGCYVRGVIKGKKRLLPIDDLTQLGCKQRPPEAIVFGVKKGGTTTLKEFLAFHPGVSVAPKELKFLSDSKRSTMGLEGYASFMPYSLPDQIPIEKTPGYMVRYQCIERLKSMIPECKLIAILSDPVKRAVSDFVHMAYVRDIRKGGARLLSPDHADRMPHYEVGATFKDSVLYPNGSVKTWNTLIDTSLYYKHAKVWMEHFPVEHFLFLDSFDLVNNPVKFFQEIETFLGLSPFFSNSVFHFNETKGFYCIRYPIYSCMPPGKGRPHPAIDESIIKKLQDYFEPYNRQFSELVGKKFSWTMYSSSGG